MTRHTVSSASTRGGTPWYLVVSHTLKAVAHIEGAQSIVVLVVAVDPVDDQPSAACVLTALRDEPHAVRLVRPIAEIAELKDGGTSVLDGAVAQRSYPSDVPVDVTRDEQPARLGGRVHGPPRAARRAAWRIQSLIAFTRRGDAAGTTIF
jgi:hypothetical protein